MSPAGAREWCDDDRAPLRPLRHEPFRIADEVDMGLMCKELVREMAYAPEDTSVYRNPMFNDGYRRQDTEANDHWDDIDLVNAWAGMAAMARVEAVHDDDDEACAGAGAGNDDDERCADDDWRGNNAEPSAPHASLPPPQGNKGFAYV